MAKKNKKEDAIFLRLLKERLPSWVDKGLIKEEQGQAIFDHVGLVQEEPHKEEKTEHKTAPVEQVKALEKATALGRLARMLMWIAVILVAVGIFHFYGANWRFMSPGVKLIQVFAVLLGFYSASFYCLTQRRSQLLLGRALLMLGILSFGASLGLIAQIFHISSRPTNGVLAWALVAGAMAWVAYERWAAYLGSLLIIIWTIWEWGEYANANWPFLPVLLAMFYLYYSLERRGGMIFSFLTLLLWVLQVCKIYGFPGQAFLIWIGLCLAVAFAKKETWAVYLAAFFLPMWDFAQTIELEASNYYFIPVIFLIGYAFYYCRSSRGLVVLLAEAVLWFYLFNGLQLAPVLTSSTLSLAAFVALMAHIPFGLLLMVFGKHIEAYEQMDSFGRWSKGLGALILFGALLMLSLVGAPKAQYPMFVETVNLLALEYVISLVLAFIIHFLLTPPERRLGFVFPLLLTAAVLFCLPLGYPVVLAAASRLTLIAALGSLCSAGFQREGGWETKLAVALGVMTVLAHQLAALAAADRRDSLLVAHMLAYLSFGLVLFLINHAGKVLAQKRNVPYPDQVLTVICGISAYFTLYTLSFKLPVQDLVTKHMTSAFGVVLVFLVTAIGLLLSLWRNGGDKSLLKISAMAIVAIALVTYATGPAVEPLFYGIVFNFLLIALVVAMIFYATKISSPLLANVGIAGFLLFIVTRYFDVLWDMLSGSVLFIVTGLLALGGGYLVEKSRCKIMAAIHEEGRGKE